MITPRPQPGAFHLHTVQPLAFIDLETTGGTAALDRITEIGIVTVDAGGVAEWSTLVNPQTPIPPFIQKLTGIDDAMVAGAPVFAEVADAVQERLAGRLFIAHNARFDHGFLKSEFKRLGIDLKATVLCTVRLSRRLYPEEPRHGLDALIARHGLTVATRHRALDDARVIWHFWQKARAELSEARIDAEVAALTAQPKLPPQLDPNLAEEIPEGPGVYLFYGEDDQALYVGKSSGLRRRVLAHFGKARPSPREAALAEQVRRIDWIETGGELGTQLAEADLVRRLHPRHNRQPKVALSRAQLAPWPYGGPIAVSEGAGLHLLDDWRYLGTADGEAAVPPLLAAERPPFDGHTYTLLVKHLAKPRVRVLRLTRD